MTYKTGTQIKRVVIVNPSTEADMGMGATTAAASMSVTPGTDSAFVLETKNRLRAGDGRSYSIVDTGLSVAATPTDIFTLSGAANKLIIPIQFSLALNASVTSLVTIDFIRRSAANTTGTFTNITGQPMDTAHAAHSAVFQRYTANAGALGAAIGTYSRVIVSVAANTSAPSAFNFVGTFAQPNATFFDSPLIIRNGQFLCANGASSAATLTVTVFSCKWVELDI